MVIAPSSLALAALLAGSTGPPTPITIPFELDGNHTFIEVTLRGKTLSFVFDTGAGGVALSEIRARHLGIEATGTAPLEGAGGAGQAPIARGLTLRVGELRLEGVTAALLPLRHLEELVGRPLDGIIGRDVMRGRVVLLDYDRNLIEVHPRQDFPFEAWGEPCALGRGLPRVDGAVRLLDGTSLVGSFYLDSGAGMFLGLNTPFVAEHRLGERVGTTYPVTGRALTGVPIHDAVGRVRSLSFCGFEVPRSEPSHPGMPVRLSGATGGVQAERATAGLIGNGVLMRFNAVFDLAGDRMYLKPNGHWADPIRSDCSGLRLVRKPDGTVRVDEIVAGSPAAEAELAPGDRLVAFDGVDPSTLTLEALRRRLSDPGKLFRIETERDGNARTAVLESRTLF